MASHARKKKVVHIQKIPYDQLLESIRERSEKLPGPILRSEATVSIVDLLIVLNGWVRQVGRAINPCHDRILIVRPTRLATVVLIGFHL
jgi:hypothetical protein